MKLTIEATDPVEIAQLAGYLAGVKPSCGLDVANVDLTNLGTAVEQTTPPTQLAQSAKDQGAKKRGRPKKSEDLPEVSTVASSTDASADAGVEYETVESSPVEPSPVPTVEEVKVALVQLADMKGIAIAAGLAAEYAESRKAQDVPEDKRSELISRAEALKAE